MYGKNIVVGVTGGIACYKACEIVSGLKKLGANVDVIMTKNAINFVSSLTFETLSNNPVISDMFHREKEWEVEHISLAKKADAFIIAPATANIIDKIAAGIADDMLTTTVLATKAPVIIAPAMNTDMYTNQLFQDNLKKLKKNGCIIISPQEGRLACGDVGMGKMSEPTNIIDKVLEIVMPKRDLIGKVVLITAGGTVEKIDTVRFIGNFSSGKMGCALAKEAIDRGAKVILVIGNHNCDIPKGVEVVNVSTTAEMMNAVMNNLQHADIVIKAAAPCDYYPEKLLDTKLKSDEVTIKFKKNPDIAKAVGEAKGNKVLIVFAAESENLINNAMDKLRNKSADFVVANDITAQGAGFGVDTNIVTVIDKKGTQTKFEKMTKVKLASKLFDYFLKSGAVK